MDNHTDVPNMPDISISQAGIYQLLTSLDEHKASGPDRISPYILKHCADEITPTLGPYLVIISFSSTARILLKLPHGKPLFTLRMLRRTRDTKLL